ncbi:MAG: hypothetical protein ACK5N4_10000 [Parabacteroides gordonii]|uniref:hypothetical protein n=1 Tax=Parabacteroides TaxID=375288 RepID=UPI001E63849B|nr:hypothetical protein [Parabacteroides sp. HGS0025]
MASPRSDGRWSVRSAGRRGVDSRSSSPETTGDAVSAASGRNAGRREDRSSLFPW